MYLGMNAVLKQHNANAIAVNCLGGFYGGHIHIRPRILEKWLHESAANSFKGYRSEYGHRRCFVIGNGPSLNKLDMTKLKDEVTIGSNGLYLNYEKMGFHELGKFTNSDGVQCFDMMLSIDDTNESEGEGKSAEV